MPSTKKAFKGFKIMVRSRHPSHSPLRKTLSRLMFRTLVRLGSLWAGDTKDRIECNSAESVKISANKLLMKQAFNKLNVITSDWFVINNQTAVNMNGQQTNINIVDLPFPLVAKHIHGSRGTGNYLIKTHEQLTTWLQGKNLNNYIFERFYNYPREYRLHVTTKKCFYTCRKMLKSDTPDNKRWYRNDSNSVWVLEDNPSFDKPVNWDTITAQAVLALKAVGLDIGAIDVKVQSSTNSDEQTRPNPKFIILETNSAPSLKTKGLEHYLTEIPTILYDKKHQIQ